MDSATATGSVLTTQNQSMTQLVTIVVAVVLLSVTIASVSCEQHQEVASGRLTILPRRPTTAKMRIIPTKPCFCPRTYKPLCASNGKTYNNQCSFSKQDDALI
uniref:Kazal-like domain-containing protein n=1 Tax=Anopheles christyi TaxID=43041 RepID=A0A182JPM1_9DIPT